MVKAKKPASPLVVENSNGGSLIRNEKLRQLYTTMLKRRALQQSAISGHEAAEVGCTIDLRPKDVVFSVQRQRQKGSLDAAVKASSKMKKTGNVLVVFSCASDHADWHQTFRVAAAGALPVLFIHWDQLSPHQNGRAKQKDISLKAQSCGFPSIPVDGHDVVAVYRVAHESILRARRGGGPTLIECKPYRLPAGGRGRASGWKEEGDPIRRMELYLAPKGLFGDTWKNQVVEEFWQGLDATLAPSERTDARRLLGRAF